MGSGWGGVRRRVTASACTFSGACLAISSTAAVGLGVAPGLATLQPHCACVGFAAVAAACPRSSHPPAYPPTNPRPRPAPPRPDRPSHDIDYIGMYPPRLAPLHTQIHTRCPPPNDVLTSINNRQQHSPALDRV